MTTFVTRETSLSGRPDTSSDRLCQLCTTATRWVCVHQILSYGQSGGVFTGYVILGKCQPSSRMAATSDPMARRFSQTRCSAPCSFSGHWHPLSYIMGIIHCQPVVLNREAVRKIQDEPNTLSVESEAKG